MGQMTYAVMLGVDAGEAPESFGDDGWYALLDQYTARGPAPRRPYGDTDNRDLIGFWVAVGASGEEGCPDLDIGFPLDGFLAVPEYKKSHRRAQKAWVKFAAWLVQTEVA